MRYLAQISEAPRTRTQSFWQDALATEAWLEAEGKQVRGRQLTLRSRGLRALAPWLVYQSQPLAIDAWLDPMDITVTWNYLVRFLVELGPERVWIPCGDDAWVGWTPQKVTIRAARESWLWALVEDVWDPASWSSEEELEWWAEGRIQHARRLPWAISEHRSWMTGWEEASITQHQAGRRASETLTLLWMRLAERLGARPVRVKWLQEKPSDGEQLLGIKARYVSCDLGIVGSGSQWLDALAEAPEPLHIRAQATWTVPHWSPDWATVMTLRRVQRGSRLEATYAPRGPLSRVSWQTLQRERRQIPILQIRPLALAEEQSERWEQLQVEAESYQHRERLTAFLRDYAWPEGGLAVPDRIRLRGGWTIWRWGSQSGLWVLRSSKGLEVHIEWPTQAHPGHLGVAVQGSQPIAMSDWVRQSRFKRLTHNPRYWAAWVVGRLLPALEAYQSQYFSDDA